jgi:hypothetical protein
MSALEHEHSAEDDDVDPRRDLTTEDWRQDAFECVVGGRDECGYLHILDREREKVVVVDEDGIDFEHNFDSDEGPSRWGAWSEHVESRRGWSGKWYNDLLHGVSDDVRGFGNR